MAPKKRQNFTQVKSKKDMHARPRDGPAGRQVSPEQLLLLQHVAPASHCASPSPPFYTHTRTLAYYALTLGRSRYSGASIGGR